MDSPRRYTPAELGEALFSGLTEGSVESIAPLLSDDASFQHHPTPAIKGKAKVLGVVRQMTRHSQWSLIERHATVADDSVFMCERTECIRVIGLELYLRGVIVLVCRDGRIERITDYMDLNHCVMAFFRALVKAPFRWLDHRKQQR